MLERKGVAGAGVARRLAENPHIFLPTVQVGITIVGVITGMFSGERITGQVAAAFARVTILRPFAHSLAFALTVLVITFLTMVLGELVPKQLALRRPEMVAARARADADRDRAAHDAGHLGPEQDIGRHIDAVRPQRHPPEPPE